MNDGHPCANCGHEITQNFCPNCGQKKFRRIDGKYIKEEIQYTILHTNKGFFYTIKNLIKNPGRTTKDYLDGNRVNHYKPILLAFVLSGITTFISYKFINLGEVLNEFFTERMDGKQSSLDINNLNTFLANYISMIMMSMIPMASIISYLVFRKQGHNYFEHVVINAFLYCFWALCTALVLYPVMFIMKSADWVVYLSFASLPLFVPFIVWFYKGIYQHLSLGKVIFKVLLFSIGGFIGYLLISISIGVLYAIYLVATKSSEVMPA